MKQEEINHSRIRALAQILVNKDKGLEAFDEYMKSAFPWGETVKKRNNEEQIKLLMQEVQRGGLAIKGPLWENKPIRSRLVTRIEKGNVRDSKQIDKLYSKLGTVMRRPNARR